VGLVFLVAARRDVAGMEDNAAGRGTAATSFLDISSIRLDPPFLLSKCLSLGRRSGKGRKRHPDGDDMTCCREGERLSVRPQKSYDSS
jgi:hypothetical protein